MYIFRIVIVAVIAVMMLPQGPDDRSLFAGGGETFCARYPATCDASDELYGAFTRKLAYGVVLARNMLQSESDVRRYGDGEPNRAPGPISIFPGASQSARAQTTPPPLWPPPLWPPLRWPVASANPISVATEAHLARHKPCTHPPELPKYTFGGHVPTATGQRDVNRNNPIRLRIPR